jgi:hypothetical protein
MGRIVVPVTAYTLDLYPASAAGAGRRGGASAHDVSLRALELGLALPSFWAPDEITDAFAEANRIWIREADIEFSPVTVTARSEVVPAGSSDMWAYFINHLSPRGRGVGVGFVYDLPEQEGGWGGGRVVVLAGVKVWSGIAGFAGNTLAHELGHVLINDPNHNTAAGDASNLMYDRRNPRVANAGLLNRAQVDEARRRALLL